MDLIFLISQDIHSICKKQLEIPNAQFDLVPAKKRQYGDFASNVAFLLAKKLKKNPVQIAEQISKELEVSCKLVQKTEVAGNGFINIWVKHIVWQDLLFCIQKKGANFGFCNIGNGHQIHMEFVSANPTGPLHLGHIRGAIIFDTLAEVLKKSNFSVIKEYYINDAGKQIEILMHSVFLRYKELITGQEIQDFPDSCYPGEYVKDIAHKLQLKYGEKILSYSQQEFYKNLKDDCISIVMELIKADLAKLGIVYDFFIKESELHKNNYVEKAIDFLKAKNLISKEELEQPKGAAKNWERRTQLVFLATKFGDDQNRSLQKLDRSWTYFASDLAYHFFKIERGFNKMTIGLGADHAGYVKRLKGLVTALSGGKAEIDVKLYNIVNLFKNGSPVKLSKRKGDIIGIKDIEDTDITCQELRFAMLTKDADSVLDFDIAKFSETSDDNPIFYVQYASARCSSVLKKWQHNSNDARVDICLLKLEQEWDLIKILAKWPNIIKVVVQTSEVHKLVFYAQEVAEKFHSLWSVGIRNLGCNRFIIEENKELTATRMLLVQATKIVIASVLGVLKIDPVEQM